MKEIKEVKEVKLDGKESCISVYDYTNMQVLRDENDQRVLFSSISAAKSYVSTKLGMRDPSKYDFSFYFAKGGLLFKYEECERVDEKIIYYNEIDENQLVKYIIEEDTTRVVLEAGYYTFSNFNHENDPKLRNNLTKFIRNALRNMIIHYKENVSLSKVTLDKYNHLCGICKDSTIQVHVCSIKQLCDINKNKKEAGKKCLPFIKDKNKFNSVYVYITKDINDTWTDEESVVKEINSRIIEFLNCKYSNLNPSYEAVKLYNKITD